MDVLLLQTTMARGGAAKANRALMERLAERGHRCRAVRPATSVDRPLERAELLERLARRGIEPLESGAATGETDEPVVSYRDGGLEHHALLDGPAGERAAARMLRRDPPDRVLVAEEDPALAMLALALEEVPEERLVFVAHSPLMLPFGDDCFLEDEAKTERVRRVAGAITPSDYMRDTVERGTGVTTRTLRFPVYGSGPFPRLGRFDNPRVLFVNPCAYKGLPVFLALVRRLPDVDFAAVPTWGTTAADRAALEAEPNVAVLDPVDDIDDLFVDTRVLLAPSLWGEAFGQIATEAMLRGIPVLAANVGGLPEATLGVGTLLPVSPIERYERRFDERMLPVAVVPDQDVEPWVDALEHLVEDPDHWEERAAASHAAARAFAERVEGSPERLERFLETLGDDPSSRRTPDREPDREDLAPALDARLAHLSEAKRARLAGWLRRS